MSEETPYGPGRVCLSFFATVGPEVPLLGPIVAQQLGSIVIVARRGSVVASMH
jgi:hypothetical protein